MSLAKKGMESNVYGKGMIGQCSGCVWEEEGSFLQATGFSSIEI